MVFFSIIFMFCLLSAVFVGNPLEWRDKIKNLAVQGKDINLMTDEIYKKGEWIVHVNYGVGQVKGKDTKTLDGEKNTFLKVKTFSSEYYIPTSKVTNQ